MEEMKAKLSIIVPCLNEQESIHLFYDEIISVLNTMDIDYEIIFVNDGSTDDTLKEIKALSQMDVHVIYISFSNWFSEVP